MTSSSALDEIVGQVVATLPNGTQYRQVLLGNSAEGQEHKTPDGRKWVLVHEGVVNGAVIRSPFTVHWKATLAAAINNPIWTIPTAVMSTPRSQFAAATGPDDQIYLAGGDAGGADNSVDVYNPVDGTMKPTTPMAVARYAFALVTAWDGGIWAIGGFTDPATATDSVERYDVVSKKWTTDPSWSLKNNPTDPSNVSNVERGAIAAAVGPDNRIYLLGGLQFPPSTGIIHQLSFSSPADVLSIDPFNPSLGWRKEPSMNVARSGHTAATGIDGNIYVLDQGSAEMFDGATRTWNPIDPAPPGDNSLPIAGFATAAAPDGSIYSAGGHYTQPNTLGPITQVSAYTAYTTSSPAWISVDGLIAPRNQAAAAVAEGELFVAGGFNNGVPDPGIEANGPLAAALSPSAVAWWRFQDSGPGPNDTAATAVDSVSNSSSTIISAVHAPGKVFQGLSFSGTGSVDVSATPPDFGAGDLSVEFWVNISAVPATVVPILDKRQAPEDQPTGYHVFLYAAGVVGLQLAIGSGYANYLSTLTIAPNVWTHVAISVDRTSSSPQITFYLNGVNANGVSKGPWTGTKDADIIKPLLGSISNPADLFIGRHSFDSFPPFQGLLDELTLYNKALSWIEVRSIFLAGSVGKA
jgi:hypothetical protein